MNDEFPLKETSSIYMSGEQLYNIVQYDKPGFRYATTMFPVEAQEIRDVVSDALEEAERRGAARALREAAESNDLIDHMYANLLVNQPIAVREASKYLHNRAEDLEG